MEMPFGKYKGIELEEIADNDIGYIVWLNNIDLDNNLKIELEKIMIAYKQEIDEFIIEQEEMRNSTQVGFGDEWWKY